MTKRASLTQTEIIRIVKSLRAAGWADPELIFHANGSVTVRNGRGKQADAVENGDGGTQGQGVEPVEYI